MATVDLVQIRVEVTVATLDRVLAECHAIGVAMDRRCSDVQIHARDRRDGAWHFDLTADHPSPRGEVLYLRHD